MRLITIENIDMMTLMEEVRLTTFLNRNNIEYIATEK